MFCIETIWCYLKGLNAGWLSQGDRLNIHVFLCDQHLFSATKYVTFDVLCRGILNFHFGIDVLPERPQMGA